MAKNILVKFEMTIGDYEHSDQYIFDKEITEYQYAAIRDGKKVEWYVFDVPLAEATVNLPWGEEITYNAKTYMKYESSLCHKYAELKGAVPPCNKQDTGSGGS